MKASSLAARQLLNPLWNRKFYPSNREAQPPHSGVQYMNDHENSLSEQRNKPDGTIHRKSNFAYGEK